MEKWWKEQTIFMIIAIIFMIVVALFFIYEITKRDKNRRNKYLNVLYPKTDEIVKERKENKKRQSKVGRKFGDFLEKKGINKKIASFYIRAGKKDKTSKDLIFDSFKFLALGIALFFCLYYVVANVLIAGMVGLVIIAYPALALYSKIKSREASFRNDFPYFLQTIAFVLKNGTNFSQAFYEVTNKQEDTVLREVMLDVLTIQNINAGDYKIAFQSMTDKIKIEEVSEFVNIVIDNLEKGVSVADVFLNQAHNTSKILNLSIKKKISAVSTKILLPIITMIGALGVLFVNL